MLVERAWIWKTLFASVAISAFAWFCVFWKQTFYDVPRPANAAWNRTLIPLCSDGCAPPNDLALTAAASSAEGSLPALTPRSTPVVVPVSAPLAKPKAAVRHPRKSGRRLASSVFRAPRVVGPYAPSVRDNLNEMVIGTSLMARGILEGGGNQTSVGLDAVLSAIPAQLPTYGYISSRFGTRRSPFTGKLVHHNGVDFAVPYGAKVYATADGIVTFAGWYHALGRAVMIDHGYGIVTRYGHNSKLDVKVGDMVRRGDVIARVGSTGRSTGNHLHYEVWLNGKAIDPAKFMFEVPERPTTTLAIEGYEAQAATDEAELGLGFAMGGDDAATASDEPAAGAEDQGDDASMAPVIVPASTFDADRLLPLNLLVIGVFAGFALFMITGLVAQRPVLGQRL